ncbi:MAG: DUF2142 domain-containing protein [Anaerolineaceae bacterium]|nr:DUF2142 domain-containing protein [Anaerolineaceae bacterium]
MLVSRTVLFTAILLIYSLAGALFAGLTPRWQAPDEPAHYNYIRYLATEKAFPELVAGCYDEAYLTELKQRKFPSNLPIDGVCYEFHQPPLYYLLAVPIYDISGGWLLAVRLVSVALGAGVMVFAFYIARTLFPHNLTIALGAMAFVAFVPMHIAILASVNNDALAELILAALLLLLLRCLLDKNPLSIKQSLLIGLLLGLGLLTKVTIYIAVPLVAVMLGLRAVIDTREAGFGYIRLILGELVKHGAIIYGLALLVALPWFVRNALLYGNGDILGLGRHDAVVQGQLRTADLVTEVGGKTYLINFITTTFRSFWGQFGWMAVPMDNRTYFFLVILTGVALAGLAAYAGNTFISTSFRQKAALGLMAAVVLLVVWAYGWYNLTFVQFQGRYLFPATISLGLFFSVGLNEIVKRQWAWGLAVVLAITLLWTVIAAGYTGHWDKWSVLIIGLALLLVVSRQLAARHGPALTLLLLIICYAGLGLLVLAAPFWFVVPYL